MYERHVITIRQKPAWWQMKDAAM